ncbi:hypothetical protein [Sporosarcina sp. USHLN248]|uniref:hypothetical protein n=1 Tax=Sporosarcina sp. USHLN248 TaxID=3081300 RepID=UPI00301B1392
MTKLTNDQIQQLNNYSIYLENPQRPLFSLEELLHDEKNRDCLLLVQAVSSSPNLTVAASFFMRRFGMMIAMQLTNLTMYDEIWDGPAERMKFGALEEYGNRTVSTFIETGDWKSVDEEDRIAVIRGILSMADSVIRQIRKTAAVSPITLWENIFGFLLWQYHVLLNNPGTSEEAQLDLQILKDDRTWESIAPRSRFAAYLKGKEPSELLNTTVRTTCCLSKDVPGLMQCGFCPLK